MEDIKQKLQDLELALNYVCYDAELIPKLSKVWEKLELLQEVVNKKCNIPTVSCCSFDDSGVREDWNIIKAELDQKSYTPAEMEAFAEWSSKSKWFYDDDGKWYQEEEKWIDNEPVGFTTTQLREHG